jgi:hypothetical protein
LQSARQHASDGDAIVGERSSSTPPLKAFEPDQRPVASARSGREAETNKTFYDERPLEIDVVVPT